MHSASRLCSQEIEDYKKHLSLLHGLELSLWALGLYRVPRGAHSKYYSAPPLMAISKVFVDPVSAGVCGGGLLGLLVWGALGKSSALDISM